jgi:hypothetical protein
MTAPPLAAALALHRRGFALVPVPLGEKRPVLTGWQDLRLMEADLPAAFGTPTNVGVLLGAPSGRLTDVDLDCPEALTLADTLLLPTAARFGRTGTPGAHRLYRVAEPLSTTQYRDPLTTPGAGRSMLVELRSTGAQTLVPPSIHPSGEAILWQQDGEPAQISAEELQTAVGRLAAASLLARHWPALGSRHAAALALAGSLLRAGWTEDEVTAFIGAVVHAAGDEETTDRMKTVETTAEAVRGKRPTTGWPSLATLIDTRVVDRVRDWIGIRDPGTAPDASGVVPPAAAGGTRDAPAPIEQRAHAIPVPPFPLEVFPPLVARFLGQGSEAVGAPADLLAVPFLGYAAAAIGNRRRLALKRRWVRKATLWTGVVAASGEGKSPADAYARAPLDVLQAEADERFQEQDRAYRRDMAQWKATDPVIRGDEPRPPLYEHWYTTDPTVEALAPMLHANPGVVAAFDELVAWARGCNAYKRGGNDRQKYLEVWNGRPLKVDRKTQGALYVPDPVLGIVGGIQPERLSELTREASVHDGLLPRFCWTYPDVTPRDWDWTETETDELDAIVELFRQLRASPVQSIGPAPEARVRWAAWYDATMRSRGSMPPLAREVTSKMPAHLATLWLVLHCLWDPEGRHEQVSLATLDHAIELVTYFRAHARRVLVHFGTSAPHLDAGLTERVEAILRRADRWVRKTELWDALHRNVKAEALGALLAEGRATTRTEGTGPATTALWRWCAPADADVGLEDLDEDTSSGGKDDAEQYDSYESTNHIDGEPPLASFTSYEPADDADTTVAPGSLTSYEESERNDAGSRTLRPMGRCYACGGSRFASDGVCLTCHPRPWLTTGEGQP